MGLAFLECMMSHPAFEYPTDDIISAMLRVTERRLWPRHLTSKVGKIIILHPERSDIVCTVRNISPAGGLLLLVNARSLPEEFNLQIEGYIRHCIARWRHVERVGVKFKSIAPA